MARNVALREAKSYLKIKLLAGAASHSQLPNPVANPMAITRGTNQAAAFAGKG